MSTELNGQPRDQQGRFQEKSKPPQSSEETIGEYMKYNQSTEQQLPAAGQQQKPPEPQPEPAEPQVGDMKEDSTTGENLIYVKEDGEGVWVDKQEAAKGYMRRSHFTRKTQQVNRQLEQMQGQQPQQALRGGQQQQYPPQAPRQGLEQAYGNQAGRGPDTGAWPEQSQQHGQAPQGYQQSPPQVPDIPEDAPDPIDSPRDFARFIQQHNQRMFQSELQKRDQVINRLLQQQKQQNYEQGRKKAHQQLQERYGEEYDPAAIEETLAKMNPNERPHFDNIDGYEQLFLRQQYHRMRNQNQPRQPQQNQPQQNQQNQPHQRQTPYAESPRGTASTPSNGPEGPLRTTDEIHSAYTAMNQQQSGGNRYQK